MCIDQHYSSGAEDPEVSKTGHMRDLGAVTNRCPDRMYGWYVFRLDYVPTFVLETLFAVVYVPRAVSAHTQRRVPSLASFVRARKVANWLPRPGKARVTYAEGSSFEGVFNGERIKEGPGKYTWMKPAEEDGEDPQVRVCA